MQLCSKSVRSWCDGLSNHSFMVDPLSYFSFQPVLHDKCNKGHFYVLSCLWDDPSGIYPGFFTRIPGRFFRLLNLCICAIMYYLFLALISSVSVKCICTQNHLDKEIDHQIANLGVYKKHAVDNQYPWKLTQQHSVKLLLFLDCKLI